MIVRNHVIITGNLGADPQIVHESEKNGIVVRISVANSEYRYDQESKERQTTHVNWIPVTAFSGLAKRVSRSLKKGDLVTVTGAIRASQYKDSLGKTLKAFEVIATDILKSEILPSEGAGEVPSFDDFREETVGGV
ncbi:MAG: single-stranded DNA-binding protein [Bdellovibrionales bacterium]|nr:single-stranded DNA-binding protein [Bdellovibrionales bacterium]